MRHTHTHRQREKQAPFGEPDVELDPRTPGSCPEPKADTQLLSHPGIPEHENLDSRVYLLKKKERKRNDKISYNLILQLFKVFSF